MRLGVFADDGTGFKYYTDNLPFKGHILLTAHESIPTTKFLERMAAVPTKVIQLRLCGEHERIEVMAGGQPQLAVCSVRITDRKPAVYRQTAVCSPAVTQADRTKPDCAPTGDGRSAVDRQLTAVDRRWIGR